MLVPLRRGHSGLLDLGDLMLHARRSVDARNEHHRQQGRDDEVPYRQAQPASIEQQPGPNARHIGRRLWTYARLPARRDRGRHFQGELGREARRGERRDDLRPRLVGGEGQDSQ